MIKDITVHTDCAWYNVIDMVTGKKLPRVVWADDVKGLYIQIEDSITYGASINRTLKKGSIKLVHNKDIPDFGTIDLD